MSIVDEEKDLPAAEMTVQNENFRCLKVCESLLIKRMKTWAVCVCVSVCPRGAKRRRREGDLIKAGVVVVVASCCQPTPFARVTTVRPAPYILMLGRVWKKKRGSVSVTAFLIVRFLGSC